MSGVHLCSQYVLCVRRGYSDLINALADSEKPAVHLKPNYWGGKAGLLAAGQMPLAVFLALKNNPVTCECPANLEAPFYCSQPCRAHGSWTREGSGSRNITADPTANAPVAYTDAPHRVSMHIRPHLASFCWRVSGTIIYVGYSCLRRMSHQVLPIVSMRAIPYLVCLTVCLDPLSS